MLSATSDSNRQKVLAQAKDVLQKFDLPERVKSFTEPLSLCSNARALLQRSQPSLLPQFMPAAVAGDGNCLFRAVSLALFGVEMYHIQLRALAAVEILSNPDWFDTTSQHCMHLLKDNAYVVLPSYTALCTEVCGIGHWCGISTILALSSVTGFPIQTFWPPICSTFEPEPLTSRIVGRNVASHRQAINVMWSSSAPVDASGPVTIDHFVPLLPMADPTALEPPAVIDSSDSDGSAACTSYVPVVEHSEFHNAGADRRPFQPESSVSPGPISVRVVDGGARKFMTADELFNILSAADTTKAVKEVPKGLKSNVWYLVDNSHNVTRRAQEQKNQFWDDCEAWETKQTGAHCI